MTDLNAKKLEPIGYLNKMTGHIWTPVEQPDAAEHPGLYEPLVRLSDAMGLAAENVALKKHAKIDEYEKCDNCGFESYVMPIETPNTDAAIAEIGEKQILALMDEIEDEASECPSGEGEHGGLLAAITICANRVANLRAGRKG